jgi:hypothetical protein
MSLQEPSHNFSTPPSEHHARKRPVSERRIQANRRNALRSTGPKTARGKRTVARNAIKHGLLAREVVITAGDGEENLEEFHSLLEGLLESYEPMGVVEESLVQTIAACWWRKARVIRAENGEIRKRLDTLAVDRALRISDKSNLDLAMLQMKNCGNLYSPENRADEKVSSMDRLSALQGIQSGLRGHHSGLAYLSALLRTAKSEVASDGYISEGMRKEIFVAFCLRDCLFALTCLAAGPPKTKGGDQSTEDVSDEPTDKNSAVVADIDRQLETIRVFQGYASEREDLQRDAEARSFSLPPAVATDKLLRYEAHLDRQLYRAMDQLERLQRQRRGENVPPPLNINLGKRS